MGIRMVLRTSYISLLQLPGPFFKSCAHNCAVSYVVLHSCIFRQLYLSMCERKSSCRNHVVLVPC